MTRGLWRVSFEWGFQTMRTGGYVQVEPETDADDTERYSVRGIGTGAGGRAVRNGRRRRRKDECLASTLINHTAPLAFYTLMRIKYARAGYRCVYRTSRIKLWWMYCGAGAWGAGES